MFDKYIDDLYEIYKNRSKRYQYFFKNPIYFYCFLAYLFILLIIGIPSAIISINRPNVVKIIIFFICYASFLFSCAFVGIHMDRGIKKYYKQLYNKNDMKPDSCLRYITAYYMKEYIVTQELESESKLRMITNALKNKSEQIKYQGLKLFGVLLLFLLPFWNSFVDRLVYSIESQQEMQELLKIIGVFGTYIGTYNRRY